MKKFYPKIIIIALMATFGLEIYIHRDYSSLKEEIREEQIEKQLIQSKIEEEKQKEKLKEFTLKVMDFYPSVKFSKTKKENLLNKVVDYVYSNIKGEDPQQTYITMLKKENNFRSDRRSPVGAIGLAQIMSETFKNNAKKCGMDPVVEDLNDDDINLKFGACYYQILLTENENNSKLANLAYSGGAKVVEHFKKTGEINKESAMYAFGVVYIKDKINGK